MPRRTLVAGALILLLPGTSACGAPETAGTESDAVLPADQAAAPAGDHATAVDTIPLRKDAVVKDTARIDPRLREVMASRPDSVVAVLLRLKDPERVDTVGLSTAGLETGVTAGRVMTGRILARRLPALAAVPGILSIDAAEQIEVPRPPGADARPNSNDSR